MKEQMTTTGNSAGISGKRAQTQFRKYLLERNMSERTITAYCYALKQFYGLYSQLTDKNLQLYKVFLIERYKPQTVNLRLRAMNCFVRYRESSLCPVSMVHVQQKGFLEQIISQADYEFLKQRLWEDGEYNYYFLIRLMTATGVRISELVLFDVEDVKKGYRDIYSKGNKLRRVYIPNLMQNIFPVLFLGIVNTGIGCCLYFSAIKELSAGSVAICGYLEPLSALLFSALLLSERLSFIQIIGAICIIGGAIFAESYKYIKLSNYQSKDSYCEIEDSCELSADKSVSK